jgi:hypothetical protein
MRKLLVVLFLVLISSFSKAQYVPFTFLDGEGVDIPATVVLISPGSGAVNQPLTNTFSWDQGGLDSFQLQISDNPGFTGTLLTDSVTNRGDLTISGMISNGQYYWRVRGKNFAIYGDWAETRTFFNMDITTSLAWSNRPVRLQLYPRTNTTAVVNMTGIVTNTDEALDTCLTKVYRNGVLVQTNYSQLSYVSGNAAFNIANTITAEPALYKTEFYIRIPRVRDSLIYTADSIVAGDVYVIDGQSNAQYSWQEAPLNFSSPYMRTFGKQMGNYNMDTYTLADTNWALSNSYVNIASTSNAPYNVGALGQFLQKYILDTFNMPTAVINASLSNSSIRMHIRNNANTTDPTRLYGKMLYRLQKGKLQNNVKAIIWHQGETDMGSTDDPSYTGFGNNLGIASAYTYPTYFDLLRSAWREDIIHEKIYVFQLAHKFSWDAYQSVFRERQRRLGETYADVEVIPNMGLGGYIRSGVQQNPHYTTEGYKQMAYSLFNNIKSDFYGSTDTANVNAPNIKSAFFVDFTKIGLTFSGSKINSIPADTVIVTNSVSIKNAFYLDKVRANVSSLTLSSNKDTLFLNLASPIAASYIQYLPSRSSALDTTSASGPSKADSVYYGPFLRNARGIAAMSFDSIPISQPSGYQLETIALLDKLNTLGSIPTTPTKNLMDSLIRRLKLSDLLTGMDVLFILAAEDTIAAKTNWLSGDYTLRGAGYDNISPNRPIFIPKKGYRNSNTDSTWFVSNIIPTGLGKYKIDSGTVIAWNGDVYSAPVNLALPTIVDGVDRMFGAISTNNPVNDTATALMLSPSYYNSGEYNIAYIPTRMNKLTLFKAPVASVDGMFSMAYQNKPDLTNDIISFKRNNVSLFNSPSTPIDRKFYAINSPIYLSASNVWDSTVSNFFRGRNMLFMMGKYYSSGQTDLFYTHFNWYLTQLDALSPPAFGIVQLVSPATGVTGQPLTPTVTWEPLAYASTYEFQMDNTSNIFPSPEVNVTGLIGNTYTTSSLANNTTYYWRMRGVKNGTPGGWSTVRTYNTVSLALPGIVSLDKPETDTVNIPTSSRLSWFSVSGASTYDLHVGYDFPVTNRIIQLSGLTDLYRDVTLPADTIFYWRVRARNTTGAGPWSDVRNLRTASDVVIPSAVVLHSPSNSAINQVIGITVKWLKEPNAATYILEYSTNSGMSAPTSVTGITDTTRTLSLANNTTYYWRVSAVNSAGTGSWSPIWSFGTIPVLPSIVTLVNPGDAATGVTINPTFSWSPEINSSTYDFELYNGLTNILTRNSLATTSTNVTGLLVNNTSYNWRVRGVNAAGSGPWQVSNRVFTTIVALPSAIVLSSPSDAATGVVLSPTLSWDPDGGSDTYTLQVDTDPGFSSPATISGISGTSQAVGPFANNLQLHWRVAGVNAAGTGPWSTARSFTTLLAVPPSPTITWYQKPAHMQLYQRDNNDSSDVIISGNLNGTGFDSVGIEIYRNGSLNKIQTQKITYSGSNYAFNFTHKIKSELAEYKFRLYTIYGGVAPVKTIRDTVDKVVSGDSYVITGQSNAQNSDPGITYTNNYVRTFGIQTGDYNLNAYVAGDTSWAMARADYVAFNSGVPVPYNIGSLGMSMAQKIIDSAETPVAIINGSRGGLSIRTLLANPANNLDLNTFYGKLLYRVKKAGLQNKIKHIIYYQGESDVAGSTTGSGPWGNTKGYTGYSGYAAAFDSLYTSFNTDYTALEKVIVMQVRPLTCFAYGDSTASKFRELQRQLPTKHPKVQIFSTVGVSWYTACHYDYQGYQMMGTQLYHNVGKYRGYPVDTLDVLPPSIKKAFFATKDRTVIGMTFSGSNPFAIPADTNINGYPLKIKNYFYLNNTRTGGLGISSVTLSATKDTLYLNRTSGTAVSYIGYLPNSYDSTNTNVYKGPVIRNSKGLGVLTFANVLILEYESIGMFARMSTFNYQDTADFRKMVIMDSTVKQLKAANVWNGDALYFFNNKDTVSANTNWLSEKQDSFRVIRRGTVLPSFAPYVGYRAVNGYLNTGIIPHVSGRTFTTNSGSVSVYSDTNYQASGVNAKPFGVRSLVSPNNYLGMILRTNFNANNQFFSNVGDINAKTTPSPFTNSDGSGMFTASRISADTVSNYRNSTLIGTHGIQPVASSGPNTDLPIYVGAYNTQGTATDFYKGPISVFRIGGAWNATQVSSFTNISNWYRNQVQNLAQLPFIPILSSPSTTGQPLTPTMTWAPASFADTYDLQINDVIDFNTGPLEVNVTGLTGTTYNVVSGLTNGVTYFWRMRGVNGAGAGDWSSVMSFATVPLPPPAITLTTPSNAATGVAITPNTTLSWASEPTASTYNLELYNGLTLVTSQTGLTGTSYAATGLLNNTTYNWRVRGSNTGGYGPWQASNWTFTTIVAVPVAPTLIVPDDDSTNVPLTPTLDWSDVAGATSYATQISTVSNFSSGIVVTSGGIGVSQYAVTSGLTNGVTYYWRAAAINVAGTTWSSVFSFTTVAAAPTGDTSNYYVDATGGSDGNDGHSTGTAFQTLSKLSTIVVDPNDSIFLKGSQTHGGALVLNSIAIDDVTKPITIMPYGTGTPVIQMGGSDRVGIAIQYTKHITANIKNIKVIGPYNPVTQTGGYTDNQGSTGIQAYSSGFGAFYDTSRVNISNCEVSNVSSFGISVIVDHHRKTLTAKIDSNRIYDIGKQGIIMNFNWLSGSRIYGNRIYDIYGRSAHDVYNAGIEVNLVKDVTIERNLIYNIGYHTIISGIGINAGASKNVKIRYNEIYGIIGNSAHDAEAIDLENGTDSSLVEFNYIHDTPGMGILISGNSSDSSVILSGKPYKEERGSLDSGSSDYNVVRFNLMKNLQNTQDTGLMGIKTAAGYTKPSIPGKNNQIYNNTIIYPYSIPLGIGNYGWVFEGVSDSTLIFNNLVIGNTIGAYVLIGDLTTKTNRLISSNLYWDRSKNRINFYNTNTATSYTNMYTWAATGADPERLYYNPLLTDPYTGVGDTLNNPWLIETLGNKYKPINGSITKGRGIVLTPSRYALNMPTTDMAGIAVVNGIGAFAVTDNSYTYQEESIRWMARDTNKLTTTDYQIRDSLVLGLKTDGLYNKFDIFYVLASPYAYTAKLNMVSDSFNAVAFNNPGFVQYEGFKTYQAQAGYLHTYFNPYVDTALHKYKLNQASIGIYSRTDTVSGGAYSFYCIGAQYSGIRLKQPAYFLGINDAAFAGVAGGPTSTMGLFVNNREAGSGANSLRAYQNGKIFGLASSVATGLSNANYILLGSPINSLYSNHQLSFGFLGGTIDSTGQENLFNNIENYLYRYGKNMAPPPAVALSSPNNSDTGVSITPTLSWLVSPRATSYHLQVSTVSNFASFFKNDSGLIPLTYNLTGLSNSTDYYWRVRSKNTNGAGVWSTTRTFKTLYSAPPPVTQTYYVDSLNGNDSNTGLDSISQAWKTIDKVQAKNFVHGDTIRFKAPYTYTGIIYKNHDTTTNKFSKLLINSYGNGGTKATIYTPTNTAFTFNSRKGNRVNIAIRNLKIFGAYDVNTLTGVQTYNKAVSIALLDSGKNFADSTSSIEISNCEMTGFGGGIAINPWRSDTAKTDVRRIVTLKLDSNHIHSMPSGLEVNAIWSPGQIIGNKIHNIRGAGPPDGYFTIPLFAFYSKNLRISRNLVYDCGHNDIYGSALIAVSTSRNMLIDYNEVYGAKVNPTNLIDGDGIDLDNGSDSCIIEYNYIHNNAGAGVLISGDAGKTNRLPHLNDGFWVTLTTIGRGNYVQDTLNRTGSDYNIVRYNIFKNNGKQNRYGEVTLYSERPGANNYMKRNMIYNNTFVSKAGSVSPNSMIYLLAATNSCGFDSTLVYNNIFIGNSMLYLRLNGSAWNLDMIHSKNIFWDTSGVYDTTKLGISWVGSNYNLNTMLGSDNVAFFDPHLKNPLTNRDTVGNPYMLDTLSAYKVNGSSGVNLGINVDSIYASYLTNYDIGTTDFYGTTVPQFNKYDIGAYEEPYYVYPERDLVATKSHPDSSYIWFPYTPIINFNNDSLRMYYVNVDPSGWKFKIARQSTPGVSSWVDIDTLKPRPAENNLGYETIVRKNGSATDYFMLRHYWQSGGGRPAHTNVYRSSNGGYLWSLSDTNSVVINGSYITGEDIGGIIYNSDSNKYNIYIRPKAPDHHDTTGNPGTMSKFSRKIVLIKTPDFSPGSFTDASPLVTMPKDTNQYYNPNSIDYLKGFYSMSVIKTAPGDWWAFINTYQTDIGLMDILQSQNFKAYDNTLDLELAHSEDGENWTRVNDTLRIITRQFGIKQLFGLPTIVGDEVWIYTIENKRRHARDLNVPDKWEIWRYRIKISDLNKFRP